MRQLDLFSGIGGFALAARWMGWETVQFVEKDEFCQKVLQKNFKGVPIHGDIKTFDGKPFRGTVDIITGGFPCQPFSSAGARKGTEDSRYLWPEMLRVIEEVRPKFILGENVFGITNWNDGVVFEQVQVDLETKDYEVQSFILPACGLNAPHKRYRVWFVANANSEHGTVSIQQRGQNEETDINSCWTGKQGTSPDTAHGEFAGFDWWTSEPGVCGVDDGVPNRVDRIKSLGNAIVPQVAYEIFKAIEATCQK